LKRASLLKPHLAWACALLSLVVVSACTINPVTGERQLALVTAEDEVAIGNEQYLPSQQMQGGEYLRDPALSSYVRNIGVRLAAVSDRNLPYEFVIINSSVPNAWTLPGGKIAVNRGLLLELDSEAELAAVLGHEIVHAAARHGALAMQRGLLLQGAVIVAAAATRKSDYSDIAVGAASLGAELIHTRHSREQELEADAYGMRYMSRAGYDPRAAIALQETFVRLSRESNNSGWLAGLFASHPPSTERVAANRATAASLPATGTIGRDAYMNATAQLRRDAPGYEALDAAREAFADADLPTARREGNAALERLPDEAQVEILFGDIEMAAHRPDRAVSRYMRAVELDDRFFYSHLGKADAHLTLDQLADAETEYEASVALLPTARAYLGLGRVAEARGAIPLALERYARAAESSGQAGADARAATIRLDLPAHPERYLTLATSLGTNGRLNVDIANPTELEVGDFELGIRYFDGGQSRLVRRTIEGPLAPGGTRRYATGLGPFVKPTDVEVTLDSARVFESP
jgi:predicted Zn-dependent protease